MGMTNRNRQLSSGGVKCNGETQAGKGDSVLGAGDPVLDRVIQGGGK